MRKLAAPTDFTFDLVCSVLKELVQMGLDADLGDAGDRVEIAMCSIVEVTATRRRRTYREASAQAERVLEQLLSAQQALDELGPTWTDSPGIQRIRAGVATLTAVYAGRKSASLGGILPGTQKLPC